MPTYLILILAALAVVALFMAGMSLTLIFKGHHIRSEISDNPRMRELGLKCAIQESLEQEGSPAGSDPCNLPASCTSSNCASCVTPES
ncbi:MAG: hypothetical protein LUF87_06905 [Alistipes sp.]|nr:hypothetical protein [Alistipes sp.]